MSLEHTGAIRRFIRLLCAFMSILSGRGQLPENVEENISLHQICSDLLFDSDLENVSTHLSRFLEISQPDGSYDINEYWDLIWDDVMQYINDEATQDDNIE